MGNLWALSRVLGKERKLKKKEAALTVLPTPACPRKVWLQVTLTSQPHRESRAPVRKEGSCQGAKGRCRVSPSLPPQGSRAGPKE